MLFHLRWIGFLEGLSYILLLGICMPLKYIYQIPEPTKVVGMAHGVLFVAYCLLVLIVAQKHQWKHVETFWALVASLLPFGTFVAEWKLFRKTSIVE